MKKVRKNSSPTSSSMSSIERAAKEGELNNHIHRVFIMAGDEGLEGPMHDTGIESIHKSDGPVITVPLGTPLSVAARELILSTLEHCGGERKRTAEMLGICTKTLYNRLREYGVREPHLRANGNGSSVGSVRAQ
jgi:DNA-binding NtrC family response regulator